MEFVVTSRTVHNCSNGGFVRREISFSDPWCTEIDVRTGTTVMRYCDSNSTQQQQEQIQEQIQEKSQERSQERSQEKQAVIENKPQKMVCYLLPQQQEVQRPQTGGIVSRNSTGNVFVREVVPGPDEVKCEICTQLVEVKHSVKVAVLTVCYNCCGGVSNRGSRLESHLQAPRETIGNASNHPNLVQLPEIGNKPAEERPKEGNDTDASKGTHQQKKVEHIWL